MRLRVVLVFLLAAAALFQLAVPAAGFVWLPPLDGYQVQVWIAAGLLGAGILLSLDVLAAGIARMFRGTGGDGHPGRPVRNLYPGRRPGSGRHPGPGGDSCPTRPPFWRGCFSCSTGRTIKSAACA